MALLQTARKIELKPELTVLEETKSATNDTWTITDMDKQNGNVQKWENRKP